MRKLKALLNSHSLEKTIGLLKNKNSPGQGEIDKELFRAGTVKLYKLLTLQFMHF